MAISKAARGQQALPGIYECLTLQLNATYYPPSGTWKWVALYRDPIAGTEFAREFGSAQTKDAPTAIAKALASLVGQMAQTGGADAASRKVPHP